MSRRVISWSRHFFMRPGDHVGTHRVPGLHLRISAALLVCAVLSYCRHPNAINKLLHNKRHEWETNEKKNAPVCVCKHTIRFHLFRCEISLPPIIRWRPQH